MQALGELKRLGTKYRAEHNQRYFKTGPGEYGEGDVFLGLTMPVMRRQAKTYSSMSLTECTKLLKSEYHEARMVALLVLVEQYRRADSDAVRERIYKLYLRQRKHINNWDLIDVTSRYIVGDWLLTRSRQPLYELARSKGLWDRRIAVLSTFRFINEGEFDDSLKIAKILIQDKEDLIHKAVGWMLREVGNRDRKRMEGFLRQHYRKMPRTMLRYAIEKLPKTRRQQYLKGTID